MKLNLQRETLLRPLQQIIGVVERKQTLPILSNVLIDAKDNKISITGTDLEVELIGQAHVEENFKPGTLTVPGRKLMDICRALPDNAPIELYQDKERVILKSGRSRFTLATLPAADFPSIETQTAALTFSLPQNELRHLLHRTIFAMANQDVRYYLNGMLFEITDNRVKAVATDGHRLALNSANVSISEPNKRQLIIPRKGVTELMRILEDDESNATITLSSNHLRVECKDSIFTSKLIDGRFPDYERVIPKAGDKIVTIDRDTLRAALNRAAILCNEKFRGVCFELRKNLLRILANNPEQEA
ncbi:MAG: DNA polymerase III subunit beta, partial [Coxiellaceae bacterium]|nr:DNA polymerase III subunit beta [Coxiellaceae bacterium]